MKELVQVKESGMVFEYESNKIFRIEKSPLYQTKLQECKIVEMICLNEKGHILLIEAKSSSPNPKNSGDFETYIEEISDKLSASIQLMYSIYLNKIGAGNEMSKLLKSTIEKSEPVKLVLVINGHKMEWLQPINDALNQKLLCTRKIWNTQVIVLNEILAQKYHIITAVY